MQPPRMLPAGHRVAVFDFEHTLFAMRRFLREHVFGALEAFGVTRRQFAAHYRAMTSRYHERIIPRGLYRRLATTCEIPMMRIELAIAEQIFSPAAKNYLSLHLDRIVARARLTHDRVLLICDGSEPYKQSWMRHIGIYQWFHPEEVILAPSKRTAIQRYLGPVSHVSVVSSYQRDARDLAAVLNKQGVAVLPIIVRYDHLERAIELL